MKILHLYILAALPAILGLFLWKGASFAAVKLNCVAHGKEMAGCSFMAVDVTGILSLAFFWGALLIIPSVFISVILLASVPELQRKAANPAFKRDAEKRGAP